MEYFFKFYVQDVDIGEELLTWYARPELNKNGEKSIDEESKLIVNYCTYA